MPSPIQLGPPSFKKALDEQKTLHRGEVWYLSTWQKRQVQDNSEIKLRYLFHFHIKSTLFSIHVKQKGDDENKTMVRTRVTLQEATKEFPTYHADVFFDENYLDVAAKYLIHLLFWEDLHFGEMCLNLPPLGNIGYTDCRPCSIQDMTIKYKRGSDPALFASWMALIAETDFFETLSIYSHDAEASIKVKHVIQVKTARELEIAANTDIDIEFMKNYHKSMLLDDPSIFRRMDEHEINEFFDLF